MNTRIVGLLLWIAVGVSLFLVYKNRKGPSNKPVAKQPSAAAVTKSTVSIPQPPMTLGDFSLTNTNGETVTKADIIGQPAVFAFVFSRCTSTCPPIMLETKKLHDKVADTNVRFFTVTVDPEYDTVQHFAKFADTYSPDPKRWQFLTGSKQQIHDMITRGFHQVVQEVFGDDVRPGFEFTHTNRVVLINAEGVPVKTFLILNDGDRAKLTNILLGKAPFPTPKTGNEPVVLTTGGKSEDLSTDTP